MAEYKKEKVEIKCPYYRKIGCFYIECEGISGSSKVSVSFKTYGERENHRMEKCNHYPNDCPIAKMLNEKYV